MPTVSTTKMTAQQYLWLGEDPPGIRLELVDGEVAVSPSPTPDHSRVAVQLISLLNSYVRDNDLGEVFQDVDTILDRFNVRRPDVLYFSKGRLELVGEKAMEGPPDLCIEVISPSSVDVDRKKKFSQYRKAGVMHYWIADPAKRSLEGWTLKAGKYVPSGRGQGAATVQLPPFPDLDIPLSRLWRQK
jgi:Uma2 family endonuclease